MKHSRPIRELNPANLSHNPAVINQNQFIIITSPNTMLQTSKAFSGFSVANLDDAYHFYADMLGLKVDRTDDMGGMMHIHISGNNNAILVYPKPDHQPATYTILNFTVADIAAAVQELKARGVVFEQYDGQYVQTDENGIHCNGGPLIAWFKDPSGNFLSVIEVNG